MRGVNIPKTKAEAIAHLKARGLMPSWIAMCVRAALAEMARGR